VTGKSTPEMYDCDDISELERFIPIKLFVAVSPPLVLLVVVVVLVDVDGSFVPSKKCPICPKRLVVVAVVVVVAVAEDLEFILE